MKSTGEPSAPCSAIPSSSSPTALSTAGRSAATRRGVNTEAIRERTRGWSGALRWRIERPKRASEECAMNSGSRPAIISAVATPKAGVRSTLLTAA